MQIVKDMIETGRWPSGQWQQAVNLPAYAYGGSNPPLPTGSAPLAGIAQLVEQQPSKLWVAGSSPVSRLMGKTITPKSPRSSEVEHLLGKEVVMGSIPIVGFKGSKTTIWISKEESYG